MANNSFTAEQNVGNSNSRAFEPITLTWEDINVFAPVLDETKQTSTGNITESKHKQILRNVSGVVEPGTLLAIIGSSGAGKTTLLNVLNGRNQGSLKVKGRIKINGSVPDKGLSSFSAYVQQDDLFLSTPTVREHLYTQALLKLSKDLTEQEKRSKVEAILQQMSLLECGDQVIGVSGRKGAISGGERKRLAFASSVITDPALMCCDEPTSGLDTFMAQSVVSTLRKMAAQGRTILCTIHQPSSEVFAMFDRVLIMAEGRTAFLGSTKDGFQFFNNCGHLCPAEFNPSDHFIHTLSIVPGDEVNCRAKVKEICDAYDNSEHFIATRETIEKSNNRKQAIDQFDTSESVAAPPPHSRGSRSSPSPYNAGWVLQFLVLFKRCLRSQTREPVIFYSRIVPIVGIMLFTVAIYWQQPYNQTGITNINGVMFHMLITMSFYVISSVVMTFPKEFPIFIKEHYDGLYRVDVYFLCKTLAEFPQFLLLAIIFIIPVYWSSGLYENSATFFTALILGILVVQTSVSFGYFLSSVSTKVTAVIAATNISVTPMMIIGGFFIADKTLPKYMLWLRYMSWFPYANEIILVNQWENVANITCAATDTACFATGTDVIRDYEYSKDHFRFDFGMLVVLMVAYRALAFIIIFVRAYRRHVVVTSPPEAEQRERSRVRVDSASYRAPQQVSVGKVW